MFIQSRLVRAVVVLLISVSCAFLGYYGYDWWKTIQKKRQLFLYFQMNSPITQRIPKDSNVYINLFDFKRVHSNLRGTRFYDTLAHWIDTELSGTEEPNPLMGGMLEKTILNVIGEEIGIALLPHREGKLELFAVARLAPGSDFLLGIALASNRKMKKLDVNGETVYVVPTGRTDLGDLHVLVKSGYAYAATDVQRIGDALKGLSGGPEFLRSIEVRQIPEDTFLFAHAKDPRFYAILHGNNTTFRLESSSDSMVYCSIPPVPAKAAVFQLQTNATEIIGQPSTSLAIQSIDGLPTSRFAFGFSSPENARQFESTFLNDAQHNFNANEYVSDKNLRCLPLRINNDNWTFCSRGTSSLLAEESLDPGTAASGLREVHPVKLPITLKVQNKTETISNYLEKIENGDWSEFSKAREFYFLSCIKRIQGSIDAHNREIVAEIQ